MAKELPYFKFEPNQWDSGNIQICTRESKGLFIDMCCLYWSRLGNLPYKLALIKLANGNDDLFNELIEQEVILILDGNIEISFLSEQLESFKDKSDTASKNASLRWKNIPERIKGNQVYVIRCWNHDEEFLKIGSTKTSINRRFSGKMPYDYEAVVVDLSSDLDLEIRYQDIAKGCEYDANIDFFGKFECYKMLALNNLIKFAELRNAKYVRKYYIREEEKKEDNRKEEYMSDFTFDQFWDKYPKKVAKAKCRPKFKKLKESEKDKIFKTLDNFIEYKPFESYTHPNPETYLNQKRWEDEIPIAKPNKNGLKVGDIDPKSGRPILFFTDKGRPVIQGNTERPTHYKK